MNNRPIPTLLWFITALPFVYLAYRYPGLPEIVPIHYGPEGAADAWAHKAWLWLMPVALPLLSLLLLTRFIPWIDRSDNVEKMGSKYDRLTFGLTAITSAVATYVIYEAGEEQLGHLNFLLVLLGLLIAFSGNYLQVMRPNKYVGIRTPWTLKSDKIWAKTHRLGGKIWFAGGIVMMITGLLLPGRFTAIALITALVILMGIPTWYSWRLSQDEDHDSQYFV